MYASSNCFSGAVQSTQSQQYNGFGNLKFKSDVGSYGYQPGTGRVTSVTGTTNESFAYDNMGNQTSQLINGASSEAVTTIQGMAGRAIATPWPGTIRFGCVVVIP